MFHGTVQGHALNAPQNLSWIAVIKLDTVVNAKNRVVYALTQTVTFPVALCLLHLESKFPASDKIRCLGAFVIQSRKFKCCLDDAISPYIFPPTLFSGKLAELPRKKSPWK